MCKARAHDRSAAPKPGWPRCSTIRSKKSKRSHRGVLQTSRGKVNRKQPKAGQYPANFSPYKMTGAKVHFTCLDQHEIKEDVQLIRERTRQEFKSIYFEESNMSAYDSSMGIYAHGNATDTSNAGVNCQGEGTWGCAGNMDAKAGNEAKKRGVKQTHMLPKRKHTCHDKPVSFGICDHNPWSFLMSNTQQQAYLSPIII